MTHLERVEELLRGTIPPGITRGIIWDGIQDAVKEEREACAKIAAEGVCREDIVNAIRQRGQS